MLTIKRLSIKTTVPALLCAVAIISSHLNAEPLHTQLNVFSTERSESPSSGTTYPSTSTIDKTAAHINHPSYQQIYRVLSAHLHASPDTPATLTGDMQKMAGYYSQFPAVRRLFAELEQYDWQLRYVPQTFTTQVSGSRLKVQTVSVLFDPRSAGQFKFYRTCEEKVPFCVASPADVLLHELLHAHSVLSAPAAFLAQGGMSSLLYPYEHERQTIERERVLYRAMTAIDKLPRPSRREHSGRHLAVACATCVR